jgi:prevent-host-death family protein
MRSKAVTGKSVNVHQAKTELSRLLAEVERGAEVVIARNGTPVAKLVPFPAPGGRRLRTDNWKGRIRMAPDFDAPLSAAELRKWGM